MLRRLAEQLRTGAAAPASAESAGNRVLAERHRVILGGWPIAGALAAGDPRTASLGALFDHVASAGYDGVERGASAFAPFFPDRTPAETIVGTVRLEAAKRGIAVCGDLLIVSDTGAAPPADSAALDFGDPALGTKLSAILQTDRALGCEYVTFQISLPPRHMNTGGEYRNDEAFLTLCAERIAMLQRVAHSLGMNCYIEVRPCRQAPPLPALVLTRAGSCPQTHIDRISEDLQAFASCPRMLPMLISMQLIQARAT